MSGRIQKLPALQLLLYLIKKPVGELIIAGTLELFDNQRCDGAVAEINLRSLSYGMNKYIEMGIGRIEHFWVLFDFGNKKQVAALIFPIRPAFIDHRIDHILNFPVIFK